MKDSPGQPEVGANASRQPGCIAASVLAAVCELIGGPCDCVHIQAQENEFFKRDLQVTLSHASRVQLCSSCCLSCIRSIHDLDQKAQVRLLELIWSQPSCVFPIVIRMFTDLLFWLFLFH